MNSGRETIWHKIVDKYAGQIVTYKQLLRDFQAATGLQHPGPHDAVEEWLSYRFMVAATDRRGMPIAWQL